MLTKALAVVKTKAALAVLGVVLVGGGGTAAYAATGHDLPIIGTHATAAETETADADHNDDSNHAHTKAFEGVLKAYNSGASTISVLTDDSKTPTTITVNSKTKVNGEHANTLADLSKNIGHKVEVQADKQSNGSYVAWKVTVQGLADAEGKDTGSTDGKSSDGSQHAAVTAMAGKVTSVGANSFVIQLADGKTATVVVNTSTQYKGSAHAFADIKVGEYVAAAGTTQSDGTFLATDVAAGADR